MHPHRRPKQPAAKRLSSTANLSLRVQTDRLLFVMRVGVMPKLHADGSECREGTARVPAPFAPCCDAFHEHVIACEFDIRYEWWQSQDTWVIVIAESAGGGGVAISYCPHCGTKLGGSEKSGRYIEI